MPSHPSLLCLMMLGSCGTREHPWMRSIGPQDGLVESTHPPSDTPFPSLQRELGNRPADLDPHWSWPRPENFLSTWAQVAGNTTPNPPTQDAGKNGSTLGAHASTIPQGKRLLLATVYRPPEDSLLALVWRGPSVGPLVLLATPSSGGYRLEPHFFLAPNEESRYAQIEAWNKLFREVPSHYFELPGLPMDHSRTDGTLHPHVKVHAISDEQTPASEALHAAIWARTLLGFEGQAYPPATFASEPEEPDLYPATVAELTGAPQNLEPAIRRLLSSATPSTSYVWDLALEQSLAQGRRDLAREVLARYHPLGRCSSDDRPLHHAQLYAQLCAEEGRLSCFLQLHLRAVQGSTGFTRFFYSSEVEANFQPETDLMRTEGLDLPTFFAGLTYDLPGFEPLPVDIDPYAIGRALAHSTAAPNLSAPFRTRAQDPAVDAYNRLVALQVLHAAKVPRSEVATMDLDRFERLYMDNVWLAEHLAPQAP
jgi:hypothetical protein